MIKFHHPATKTFELVMQVKDIHGHSSGKTKSYATDNPFKLWQFFMRNQGRPRKSKPKASRQDKIPTGTMADKILKTMYKDKEV